MRAFLQVIKGPGLGRKVTLREGQLLYVGRTNADVNFPENPEMSSVHFTIRWKGSECELKDQNSANGTYRNGERVAESLVFSGDEIKAGQAIFRVVLGEEAESGISGPEQPRVGPVYDNTNTQESRRSTQSLPVIQDNPPPPSTTQPPPPLPTAGMPSAEGSVGLLVPGALEAAKAAPIKPDHLKLATPDQTTLQYVQTLAAQQDNEKSMDAIRVLAFALGKLTAIEWALQCVRAVSGDGLSQADEKALAIVEKWLGGRTEELRRAAYAASQEAEHATPASWVAMAAFWSEGSMSPPPPAPPLAPGPTQCAHAVSGAILLAAVARQPEKAPDKYRQFIEMGLELAQK